MKLENEICKIKLFEDIGYVLGSQYNARTYDLIIKPKEELPRYSVFGIDIVIGNSSYSVALIGDECAFLGNHVALLEGDRLTVVQNSRVIVLSVTERKLVRAYNLSDGDYSEYFEIYRLNDNYLLHGENKISLFDNDFNELWSVTGDDVFVNPDRERDFIIADDKIIAYDYMDRKYEITFDGKIKRLY